VIDATARAVSAGWVPSSDDGIIVLRALDVLSDHPPLLGQYSQSSPLVGETTFSLGPMLYLVLALPAQIGGSAPAVTMGAISSLSVMSIVALAWRQGGTALMLAAAAATVLIGRSLPVETPFEVWNCWAGTYPFVLLLFLAWSLGCGEHRLLPLIVIVASYVVQCHLTYVLPTLCALVVAAAGYGAGLRTGSAWRRSRPWLIGALLVGLLCWTPPLIEQVRHRPGNLVLTYKLGTAGYDRLGPDTGFTTLARAVGVPPWWAKRARTPPERIHELNSGSSWPRTASALAVVSGLIAALVLALRRRQREAAVASALGLATCASIVLVTSAVPVGGLGFTALFYVLNWTSAAGMVVWLTLAWSAVELAPRVRPLLPRARAATALAGLTVVTILAVAAAGRSLDDPYRQPPGLSDYTVIRATTDRVVQALAGSRSVMLDVPARVDIPRPSLATLTFQSSIAYALRREGHSVEITPRVAREMGPEYQPSGGPYDAVVHISDVARPNAPAGRVIARSPGFVITLARPPRTGK
jgi:hypothetical protein